MPSRILVVDDEPAIREVLSRALRQAGYEVVAMYDGSAGWDAASSAEVPYDLVVSSNCMPGLSGTEMVAPIREMFPDMPILHLDDLSRPHHRPLPEDVPNLYKRSASIACSAKSPAC
jgi:DNA-binding response OmpR family regulator